MESPRVAVAVFRDREFKKRSCWSILLWVLPWTLFITLLVSSLVIILLKPLLPLEFENYFENDWKMDDVLDSNFSEHFQKGNESEWNSAPRKSSKQKVLILAQGRSGSSFLGEIFNQDKNVFYVYEPLHIRKTFLKTGVFQEKGYTLSSFQVLDNLFSCSTGKLQDYLTFISFPDLSNPHFRFASKSLSSPPLCRQEVSERTAVKMELQTLMGVCPQLYHKEVSKVCKQKSTIVIKDLAHRIPYKEISELEKLLIKHQNLHVIYIVRDPRAVLVSMRRIRWISNEPSARFTDLNSAARNICKETTNMLWLVDRLSDQFPTRVHFIRYEDLASDPVNESKQLFSKIGIPLKRRVINWISVNTNSNNTSSKSEPYRVDLRNASVPLYSWRLALNFSDMVAIQNICTPVLKNLNYVIFSNTDDLSNFNLTSFKALGLLSS